MLSSGTVRGWHYSSQGAVMEPMAMTDSQREVDVAVQRRSGKLLKIKHGSAWGPVILPVFKTGGRQVFLGTVRSTRTRFRHLFSVV
jgi:hypothetical protein